MKSSTMLCGEPSRAALHSSSPWLRSSSTQRCVHWICGKIIIYNVCTLKQILSYIYLTIFSSSSSSFQLFKMNLLDQTCEKKIIYLILNKHIWFGFQRSSHSINKTSHSLTMRLSVFVLILAGLWENFHSK